jgi:flavin-dependent thymidylate synthase
MNPKLIQDPRFKVYICDSSRQQNPDLSCWEAMHECVNGGDVDITPKDPVDAVIRHALKFGHWEVLHHASIKLKFEGFPHSTAMQFRTHQDAHTLVQSLRYSNERYTLCADGKVDPDELFYFPPNNDKREQALAYGRSRRSCVDYAKAIERGEKKEDARNNLTCNYRQGFTISATFCDWFHIFDRRLLADAQLEAQTAAWMALYQLIGYSRFFEYYRQTRAGKNMLAP